MKTIIPENLTSIYDIAIPHLCDVRNVRKLLNAELEKLHPCFPERCAVDYHIRLCRMNRNTAGFHVKAVVMDRFKLAEFRKKNAGRTLYLSGSHPYPVFSREIFGKRFAYAGMVLLVIIGAFSAIRIVSLRKTEYVQSGLPVAESPFLQQSTGLSEEDPSFPEDAAGISENAGMVPDKEEAGNPPVSEKKDYSAFFSSVYEWGGRFSAFSWSDGLLSLKVEGLYPEQIAAAAENYDAADFSSVSYQDGKPVLAVTFHTDAATGSAQKLPEISFFRQLVLDCGGKLSSETVNPPSLSGSIPESEWPVFGDALSGLSVPSPEEVLPFLNLQQLEFSREGGTVFISLQYAESDGRYSLPVTDFFPLFSDAHRIQPVPEEVPAEKYVAPVVSRDEIGRITRGDGASVIFYHNKEGEIESMLCEN